MTDDQKEDKESELEMNERQRQVLVAVTSRSAKTPRNEWLTLSMRLKRTVMAMTDDVRVTARIVRTDDGENYTEYRVGGVSYPSAEALEAALEAR